MGFGFQGGQIKGIATVIQSLGLPVTSDPYIMMFKYNLYSMTGTFIEKLIIANENNEIQDLIKTFLIYAISF